MRARALGRWSSIAAAILALCVLLPEAAHACPVCFDSSDENRAAFLLTTAFLSLLPLGMVAGAGLWLRKKQRERDGASLSESEPESDW